VFDSLLLASSLYLEHQTGELAGMYNVALKPSYTIGTRDELVIADIPDWHNRADVYVLYGSALVDNGARRGPEFLEVRGTLSSLYTLYNSRDVLTFNTGPTFNFAYPLHHYASYVNPETNVPYANEENEKIDNEQLLGWNFNISVKYDKSRTSIDNVLYVLGNRIGPNLLAYQPAASVGVQHEIFLMGNVENPGLSLFVDMDFWFARKAHTAYFNSHDGLGATKRELFISYGTHYYLTKDTMLYLDVHGYNNLNRGSSATTPSDFRDGFLLGIEHRF
jgi:hypothetical protein